MDAKVVGKTTLRVELSKQERGEHMEFRDVLMGLTAEETASDFERRAAAAFVQALRDAVGIEW